MAQFVGIERQRKEILDSIAPLEEIVGAADAVAPEITIDLAQLKATIMLSDAVLALANMVEAGLKTRG